MANGVSGNKDGGFGSHDLLGGFGDYLSNTFGKDTVGGQFGSALSGLGSSTTNTVSKTVGSFTGANAAQEAADTAKLAAQDAKTAAAKALADQQTKNMQSDLAASSGVQAIRNSALGAGGTSNSAAVAAPTPGVSATAAAAQATQKDFLGL